MDQEMNLLKVENTISLDKVPQRSECKGCGCLVELKPTQAICLTCGKSAISTLPRKYRELPDEYCDDEILNKFKDTSACFFGEAGSGKSTQAVMIFKHRALHGRLTKWVSFPSLILKLQADFDAAYERLQDVSEYHGMVILDDFGAYNLTPFVQQCIYEIINRRDEEMLTTLITTNMSMKQIAARIDDRISSRIIGMCDGGSNIRQFTGDKRIKNLL